MVAFAKVCVMTVPFAKGRFGARFASSAEDVAACQALRHQCFLHSAGIDSDRFDAHCRHLMIADAQGLIATARIYMMREIDHLRMSYASQYYDFKHLLRVHRCVMEVGRFCVAPQRNDPDIMRLAWSSFAEIVDQENVSLIIGCTSFAGVDASAYSRGFSLLAQRHTTRPDVTCMHDVETMKLSLGNPKGGAAELPSLLRSYLQMGAWVSGRAVIDRQMQTLHVLTGLEIDKIPAGRARSLRRIGALGSCT